MFAFSVMFSLPLLAQNSMDYTPLKPFISSGILYENNPNHIYHNSSHSNNPRHFLGDDDSVCTPSIFHDLYDFFFYANFDTATSPLPLLPHILEDRIDSTDIVNEVKLGLMHFNFEAISENALTNNYLNFDTVNNTVTLDTGWVHIQDTVFEYDTITHVIIDTIKIRDTLIYQHPDTLAEASFDTHTLFAAAAYNPWIEVDSLSDNISFSLDFIDFFSNITINPNEPYRISLDDVNFINLIPNNPPVSFSGHTFTEGWNYIYIRQGSPNENEIKVRAKFFVVLRKHVPDYQMTVFNHDECPDLDFSEGVGSGVVTFKIHELNGGVLKKPVIIVEDFEIGSFRDSVRSLIRGRHTSNSVTYGHVGWNTFSSGNVPTSLDNPYSKGSKLIDELISEGYDILFVDIATTRAKIRQNANYLMQIIQHVNTELSSNIAMKNWLFWGLEQEV